MKKLIIAKIDVKENHITEFLNLARTLVEHSNKETGCLIYKLHQEDLVPNKFLMYEEYQDQKAIEAHQNSKHFLEFKEQISPLLNSLEVSVFDLNKEK